MFQASSRLINIFLSKTQAQPITALEFYWLFEKTKSAKGEEEKSNDIFIFVCVLIKCNGSVSKIYTNLWFKVENGIKFTNSVLKIPWN